MNCMLGLSVLAASFNSILLRKSDANCKNTIFKFNFVCSLVWCFLLFLGNKCTWHIEISVLLWGILYGLAQTCFMLCKTAAMSTGPVSITTLIGNSSLLLSISVSMILWKETITIMDILGLFILCISLFLCMYKRDEACYESQWKYYAFLFLVLSASVGLIFKAFGRIGKLQYSGDMMLTSAIVMVLGNFFISLFVDKGAENKLYISKRLWIYALISGVLSCLYNRMNIFLSGSMDAIIYFPVFNGGTVLLSTLLSMFFLKEKLVMKQIIGLMMGVLAICIIGFF